MPFCFVFDYILFFEKTSDGSMLQFFKMRFILEEEDWKILIFCKPKFIENSDATSSKKTTVFWVCCREKRETYRNGSLQWKLTICEFYACSESRLSFSILQKWKCTYLKSQSFEKQVYWLFLNKIFYFILIISKNVTSLLKNITFSEAAQETHLLAELITQKKINHTVGENLTIKNIKL